MDYQILDSGDRVYYDRNATTGKIILKPHVYLEYDPCEEYSEVLSDEVLDALEDRGIEPAAFLVYLNHQSDVEDFEWLDNDEEYLDGIIDDFESRFVAYDVSIINFFEDYLTERGDCLTGSDIESDHPLLQFVNWDEALRKYALAELEESYTVYKSSAVYFYFFIK